MATLNPLEVARETLKVLATRKIIPTPENYQRIFHEISGTPLPENGADVLDRMLEAFRGLPQAAPARALEKALTGRDWKSFGAGLLTLGEGRDAEGSKAWADLLREFVKQWEIKQRGLTTARKREALERVLINFGKDPSLHGKLQALVRSWAENAPPPGTGIETAEDPANGEEAQAARPEQNGRGYAAEAEIVKQIRDLLVQVLENGVAARLARFPELAAESTTLAQAARGATSREDWQKLGSSLKQFWIRLELRAESDAELLEDLVGLLRLLTENIGELVEDDQWLHGQVAVMQQIISQPLNLRMIEDAERSFREVIFKQGMLKRSLNEAKLTLKNMISTFIERLGEVSTSTDEFHGKIAGYAEQISGTNDISRLNQILESLMNDTRSMQVDMLRSRDDLHGVRAQVDAAQDKIRELEQELEQVSEKVREDQLTGALNRRGLEEALEREMARAQRRSSPLCLALLDLDNFKKLNDTYGHQAGDEALVHLARVIKTTVRPTDVIARYGGEEFVVLLADTPLEEAINVMTRLQRELTKKFFLHNNERLLITFSAGVALFSRGESQEAVIKRADEAMYQAKQAGKNRVIAAS